MAMIFNFLVIFIFCKIYYDFFSQFYCILYMILVPFFVNTNIFSFSKSIINFAFSLKDSQNFFTQFSPRYQLCSFFLFDWTPKLLTLNVHQEYVLLFLLFKIFLENFYSNLFSELKTQCRRKLYIAFYLILCID